MPTIDTMSEGYIHQETKADTKADGCWIAGSYDVPPLTQRVEYSMETVVNRGNTAVKGGKHIA